MQQEIATTTAARPPDANQQYLTFALDQESYGVEILKVQEIKGYTAITPIPNTPPHVKGVMNLRGAVIPVVDLRTKFGLKDKEHDKFTVVIVVTVGARVVGLIVDAVSDVLDIGESDIREPPSMGIRADSRYINGLANTADKLTVLLDIDRLLSQEDLAAAALTELQPPAGDGAAQDFERKEGTKQ